MYSNESKCAICLNHIQNMVFLPCNHSFCEGCIDPVLKLYFNCPICRRIYAKPIGEDYRRKKFGETYNKNWWDFESYQVIPIIEQSGCKFQQVMYLTTQRDIYSVNIAVKTNLLLLIQTQNSKLLGFCDICKITKLKIVDEKIYIIQVETIDRGKIQDLVGLELKNKEILYQSLPIKLIDKNLGLEQFKDLKEQFDLLKNLIKKLMEKNFRFQLLFQQIFQQLKEENIDNQEIYTKLSLQILQVLQTESYSTSIFYFKTNLSKRVSLLISMFQNSNMVF